MNKKILISLGMIAVVAIVAVGATRSFFSDTETSTGNTFTAGAIDLTVDSTQHYNGMICEPNTGANAVAGTYWWRHVGNSAPAAYPVEFSACGGSWVATDLGATNKFFNFSDIKPGDSGEDTISLHVLNNDAYACAAVSNLTNADNGTTGPEGKATGNTPNGDLQKTMVWKVWNDNGTGAGGVKGDNIQNGNEPTLAEGHPVNGVLTINDSTTGPLLATDTAYLGVSWSLPSISGNETQTDSMTGDISFNVVQSRNNANFRCDGQPTLPGVTITSADTWSNVDTDSNGGSQGKEWFAKSRNNDPTNFEIAVGTNDGSPSGYNSDNTTWVAGQSNPFTLSYNGSGIATYTAGGKTVTYAVGTTGYGRIGINVKAPASTTTTVDSLALSTVSPLSPNSLSVTGGTHSITINSVTLNSAWTLTGNFTFSAVGTGTGFNQENPTVQFSID